MSESNCAEPAEKPSASARSETGVPSFTSSGPAWTRSPGGWPPSSARRDFHQPVDMDARAGGCPRFRYPLVFDGSPAQPDFAKRPVRIAHEEAGDDRLRMTGCGTPVGEPPGLGKMEDGNAGRRERVADEVHGVSSPSRVRNRSSS